MGEGRGSEEESGRKKETAAFPSQPWISSESFALPFTHTIKPGATFFSSVLEKERQKIPTLLHSCKHPTLSLPGLRGRRSTGAAAFPGLQSPACR